MTKRITRLVGALGSLGLAACAGATSPQLAGSSYMSEAGSESLRRTSNALILDGDVLSQRGGNLLTAMRTRLSGIQIRQTSDGMCPRITIRGQKTMMGPSNPQVYIDGQRANDTCILEMIHPGDVERIEVYPMGVTHRPGYLSHAYGLILVFLRRG